MSVNKAVGDSKATALVTIKSIVEIQQQNYPRNQEISMHIKDK